MIPEGVGNFLEEGLCCEYSVCVRLCSHPYHIQVGNDHIVQWYI